MGNDNSNYIVNGYHFESFADYQDALNEKKGIKYLDEQINLNDTDKLLKLYNDLHDKKVFRTPVGIEYMRMLRSTLRHQLGHDEGLRYVEVPAYAAKNEKAPAQPQPTATANVDDSQLKTLTAKVEKLTKYKKLSIFIIAVLIAVIIAMFVIAATSSNENILNYRYKIENEYSRWQTDLNKKDQELNQRERELDQRERELDQNKN